MKLNYGKSMFKITFERAKPPNVVVTYVSTGISIVFSYDLEQVIEIRNRPEHFPFKEVEEARKAVMYSRNFPGELYPE